MASMVTANLPSQPFKGATDVYDAWPFGKVTPKLAPPYKGGLI
jgi:hypothetical protein